jgi:hypothetical protein
MAPQQSALTRFLYESRIPARDAATLPILNGDQPSDVFADSLPIPKGDHVAASSGSNDDQPVEPATSSPSDCVLLNGMSTPIPVPEEAPDVQIVDPVLATPLHAAARQRRRAYDQNRHWQDSWAARLPWAESVLGRDGRVMQVRCKVCSEVERRKNLLAPKIDSLWKHARRRRALTSIGSVKKGDHYFLTTNQHVRNERLYFARVGDTIAQRVAQGAIQERQHKLVQFRLLFWILTQGRPMTDYEACRELFMQLSVPNCPRKHWSASSGWEMADSMSEVLSAHTKKVLAEARFYSVSTDEVTTVDHESWLSVHIYISVGFSRLPILLSLSRLTEGNGASAVKESILTSLSWHGGIVDSLVAERLVCFGADGVSVFQGYRTGVTQQLKDQDAPFCLGVHCMAHRTNLAVEPLSNLPVVSKLESLCQALYTYFTMSSKKHLEFQRLADIVETEGL